MWCRCGAVGEDGEERVDDWRLWALDCSSTFRLDTKYLGFKCRGYTLGYLFSVSFIYVVCRYKVSV
jgi:hypothetical protein